MISVTAASTRLFRKGLLAHTRPLASITRGGSATYSPNTTSVWGGEVDPGDAYATPASSVPVYHSVSYDNTSVDSWIQVALDKKKGHIYSRNTNPTVWAFEEKVRLLEGAESATSFASGMAAISNTLFSLMKPGERCVSIKDTYGGTNKIFEEFFPHFGFEKTLCETTDFDQIEAEVAKGCKILYLESPTNPTLKVLDIKRLAAAAKKVGAITVVDNTFATPYNQNPLSLGADLVLHSATKFLGGHADALGGVLVGRADLVLKAYHYREITGAALGPMDAYLLLRGMKTLHVRVERQNENALKIARWLKGHPKVEGVFYPGLEDHLNHDIAKAQMHGGFGGVLSFSVKGGFEGAKAVLDNLKLAHLAANLGAVDTVAGPPATTSHVECTPEERAAAGIPEGLVRYSVGIERCEDLIDDLASALDKC